MASGREHHKPRMRQLLPGGRGTRSEADGINQAESWERRSKDMDLSRDDVPHMSARITTPAATAVTAGTYSLIAGTMTLEDGYLFDMPSDNHFRYLGFEPMHFFGIMMTTVTSNAANTEVYFRFGLNGTTVAITQMDTKVVVASDIGFLGSCGIFELAHHDVVSGYVNTDKNANITFSQGNMSLLPYGRFPLFRAGRGGPQNLSE